MIRRPPRPCHINRTWYFFHPLPVLSTTSSTTSLHLWPIAPRLSVNGDLDYHPSLQTSFAGWRQDVTVHMWNYPWPLDCNITLGMSKMFITDTHDSRDSQPIYSLSSWVSLSIALSLHRLDSRFNINSFLNIPGPLFQETTHHDDKDREDSYHHSTSLLLSRHHEQLLQVPWWK